MAQSKILRSQAVYYLGMFVVSLYLPLMRAERLWRYERFDGVAIGELKSGPSSKEFYRLTREALELIKSWDARRYRRVVRNINHIANYRGLFGRNYLSHMKFCAVDYDKCFTTYDAEWNVRFLACCLIEAATLGVIERKAIPIYWKNRERIGRLLNREAHSFAMRIDPVWAEEYLGPNSTEDE